MFPEESTGEEHRGPTLWTRPCSALESSQAPPPSYSDQGQLPQRAGASDSEERVPSLRLALGCTESWNILPCWTGTWIPGMSDCCRCSFWQWTYGSWEEARLLQKAKIPKNVSKKILHYVSCESGAGMREEPLFKHQVCKSVSDTWKTGSGRHDVIKCVSGPRLSIQSFYLHTQ